MGNIYDYIDWRGDITMDKSGFNCVDGLILAQIAYVPFDGVVKKNMGNGMSLAKAARKYEHIFELKSDAEKNKWLISDFNLLMKAAGSQRFGDLRLCNYVQKYDPSESVQFGAVTVRLNDELCVVAFRGTDDTFAGWEEDFKLCYKTPVAAHLEAEKYLRGVCGHFDGRIYVCGHSKGGNLSVYASMMLPDEYKNRIVSILNYDGPGFLQNIVETPEYRSILPKIETYMPQQSIVGMIMYHDEGYSIVHSVEKGFQQHLAGTWSVLGNKFVTDKDFDRRSVIFNSACKKWVSEISADEREKFIEIVFRILKSGESDTVTGFTAKIMSSMNSVIKSYKGLDKVTRRMVRGTVKQMIKLGTKSISENRKEIAE